MASLRQKARSPYFFACYAGADGRRVQRSTKQSNRKKAQAIADKWEHAARLAAEKRLGEAQARRVLSEIYEVVNNEPLPSATAKQFLTNWVERRKSDTSNRTYAAYAQVVRDFLQSLGAVADRDVSQIRKSDVAKYRDLVLARTSAATANKSLKYLRVALGAAYKDGLTQDNPAAKLDTLKRHPTEIARRRPFTVDELRKILEHASEEWKGLIKFGLYTGQRLKDIARLTWRNVDTRSEELRFVTGKTGRRMHLPLAKPLLAHLASMPSSDDPGAPLFPKAHAIASGPKDDSRLSQQFYALLFDVGLATAERSKDETGMGRSRKRTVNELSFHSLRHTANSILKNAGVPNSVVMDLIGHDSEESSHRYTHISQEAKRDALTKIPDIATVTK